MKADYQPSSELQLEYKDFSRTVGAPRKPRENCPAKKSSKLKNVNLKSSNFLKRILQVQRNGRKWQLTENDKGFWIYGGKSSGEHLIYLPEHHQQIIEECHKEKIWLGWPNYSYGSWKVLGWKTAPTSLISYSLLLYMQEVSWKVFAETWYHYATNISHYTMKRFQEYWSALCRTV